MGYHSDRYVTLITKIILFCGNLTMYLPDVSEYRPFFFTDFFVNLRVIFSQFFVVQFWPFYALLPFFTHFFLPKIYHFSPIFAKKFTPNSHTFRRTRDFEAKKKTQFSAIFHNFLQFSAIFSAIFFSAASDINTPLA